MTLERVLLQTIKFDLQVDHPYSCILKYAKCLKGDKPKLQKMVQMSWTFVNDSLCTTLCLQWEPEVIAIALMYLAAKLSKFEVKDWKNRLPEHKFWWDQYVKDLETDVLEDICHQVLDLYSQPTTEARLAPPSPPPGSRPVKPPAPPAANHPAPPPQPPSKPPLPGAAPPKPALPPAQSAPAPGRAPAPPAVAFPGYPAGQQTGPGYPPLPSYQGYPAYVVPTNGPPTTTGSTAAPTSSYQAGQPAPYSSYAQAVQQPPPQPPPTASLPPLSVPPPQRGPARPPPDSGYHGRQGSGGPGGQSHRPRGPPPPHRGSPYSRPPRSRGGSWSGSRY